MTKNDDYDIFGPGWNSDDRPDTVVRGDETVALWFKPRKSRRPKDWDICIPHRKRKGWVVYILFLSVFVCAVAQMIGG